MCAAKKKKNEDGSFWNDYVTISTEATRRYCFLTFSMLLLTFGEQKWMYPWTKILHFENLCFQWRKKD